MSDIAKPSYWWNTAADETGPDDPDVFSGMPVGLQAVGRRCDDEKIVAVMKLLQQHGCLLE